MRLLLLSALLAAHLAALAQGSLHVTVLLNKPEPGGTVHLLLCPTEKAMKSGEGCAEQVIGIAGTTVRHTFEAIAPGVYAVKVFQDVNGNGVLDVSWLGWPKEPLGFSNDVPLNMGVHPFKLAALYVQDGPQSVRIRLQ